MTSLSIRLSLLLAAALAIAAWLVLPRGIEAGHWLAAEDDPARLADLGLDRSFDARVAAREIEAALHAGDVELAESFIALARERNVNVDPTLEATVAAEATSSAAAARGVGRFVRGFVVGEPDDLVSLAGTATGDLFVFGDARDALREGVRLARGEEADELILGLACVGLAVTAGTYVSLGAGAPAPPARRSRSRKPAASFIWCATSAACSRTPAPARRSMVSNSPSTRGTWRAWRG